jgi:hypothetical protein
MNSTSVRRFLARARIGLYAFAALAIVYLGWRFDTLTLPEEGCSPIRSIAPGARLFVDLHPRTIDPGDRLLFRAADGELLLGVAFAPPESAPPEYGARVAAGEIWIVADDPGCPARDSRALGPIPRERVEGRIFLAL